MTGTFAARRWAGKMLGALLVAGALAMPAASTAKIDLVTLPSSDKTQLTIYKSEDLTLARETRTLTFSEGKNQIQFSWANTLIDPTSLQIQILNNDGNLTVLDASYPPNAPNTIIWNIDAEEEDSAQVEITYFASGLSWEADYSAFANADETNIRLEPYFTISNNSGEDFVNAETRLVVGEVNLVEAIAELARRGMIGRDQSNVMRQRLARGMMKSEARAPEPMMESMALGGAAYAMDEIAEAKEIVKAAVSEYYLYAISGTESIDTGWSKQLPDPPAFDVPIDVSYEYDPAKYGNQVTKFYKLKNDEEHELGKDPLPAGRYYVYSEDGQSGLRFEASYSHKYVPIGEDIELNLGNDGMVLYEEREMSFKRGNFDFDRWGNPIGWEETSEIELEIRNSKTREVPIKIRRYMNGDWSITEASDEYKKVDQNTVEWKDLMVPPKDKRIITITVVTRTGSLVNSN
ncbi:hypothetical protein KQI84_10640 [bacterium]|nr:hypothetical protein [bacterium]